MNSVMIWLALFGAMQPPPSQKIRVTVPPEVLERAISSALGPGETFNFMDVVVTSVTASASPLEIEIDSLTRRARLISGPVIVKFGGYSGRGHGLDLVATVSPLDVAIELGVASPIALVVDIESRVRACPATWSKKVLFRGSVVKPIVINPFQAGFSLSGSVLVQRNAAEITLGTIKPLRGELRVGAIGDLWNIWGTLAPLDAPNITLRKAFFKFTLPNPLRDAFGKLNGKSVRVTY